MNDWLNDKQYNALLVLWHEYKEAFSALPAYMQEAFYIRLYKK